MGTGTTIYTWNQVPKQINYEDRTTKYEMVVTRNDNVANRTYTITYVYQSDNQTHVAGLTIVIDYKDRRPTKTVTTYYNQIN